MPSASLANRNRVCEYISGEVLWKLEYIVLVLIASELCNARKSLFRIRLQLYRSKHKIQNSQKRVQRQDY